jgi:hypothetical protein
MTALPRFALVTLALGAVPAHAAPQRLVQHGDHLAVVAMVRQAVQTAKVRQGALIARYRAVGSGSETVAQARCDAHRWQEACTVALTGLGGAVPGKVTVAFQPRG